MRPLIHRRRHTVAAGGALLLLCLSLAPAATASSPTAHVIAWGLNNPRGIAVSSGGRVLVAEAGTGKVLAITGGRTRTLASGLPSVTSPEGETTGVVNVAVRDGKVTVAIGEGPQNLDRRFNTIRRLRDHGSTKVADIQRFRDAHPDTTDLANPSNPTESNPYGLAALSRSRFLVTDAAGNELDLIGSDGRVRKVAKFPNAVISTLHLPPGVLPPTLTALPAEAVPTSVAVGPDGWWYVGELKGFPFTPGASRIWRVAPWARNVLCDPAATSGPCTVFADGFTSITGLDFGPDGSLYVVEIVKDGVFNLFSGGDITGALIRLKGGVRTELAAGELHAPADVAIGRNGTVYVTDLSVSPDGGRVVAIH